MTHPCKRTKQKITHLGRNPNQLLGVHVALALFGLLDVGERGRNDDGLAIVGEALDGNTRQIRQWQCVLE